MNNRHDKLGIDIAQATSQKSSSIGRKIGACILDNNGRVLSTGYNEAPDICGGSWKKDSNIDLRDCTLDNEERENNRLIVLANLASQLVDIGLLKAEEVNERLKYAINNDSARKAQAVSSIVAFSHATHAETAAIINAASNGISISGATLYTTLFPCEACFRHTIHAGIRKIVYLEDNPWSKATVLYKKALKDSIEIVKFS